ncbi:MAG: histidine phosphatase family protein [Thermoguttaceae bacterium]
MAKRLLLVRHAQLAAGHLRRFVGRTDPPLDPIGRRQSQTLAAEIGRLKPQRVYCSPLERCRQTAAAIAPDLAFTLDDDLREIDFGHWENMTFDEVAAREPALVEHWATRPDDFAFPGGEKVGDFLARVRRAADRMARDDAEVVLAVTHGGVIRAMLCCLLGLEAQQYVLFSIGYAATAVIDLFDGRGVLAYLGNPVLAEGGRAWPE